MRLVPQDQGFQSQGCLSELPICCNQGQWLTSSSWLAGGAEGLIASVFEAGPPPSLSSQSTTSTSHNTSESESEPAVVPAQNPRSPLAKLYGQSSASRAIDKKSKRKSRSSKKPIQTSEGNEDDGSEVVKLKKELAEVKGSQLRMEEMLGRLLAGRDH